jgi:hypothetical protein
MELATTCVSPIPAPHEQTLINSMTTGILAVVVMIFTFMFPESPRWLALKGRMEEARQVIAVIDDVEPDSPHVDFIIASITSMNEIAGEKASFFSLFKYGKEKIVYRLLIASATQLFSQMSGSALIHTTPRPSLPPLDCLMISPRFSVLPT